MYEGGEKIHQKVWVIGDKEHVLKREIRKLLRNIGEKEKKYMKKTAGMVGMRC